MMKLWSISCIVTAACLVTLQFACPVEGADKDKEKDKPKEVTTKSGLKYVDLKEGDGAEAKEGSTVDVHYTGTLTDGKKFDSSLDRGKPFSFTIPGMVIKGWNEGIQGMKVGGKRKLIIPPDLGYGEQVKKDGKGNVIIPANSTLIFEVELVKVK